MTRKDYKLIAAALHEAFAASEGTPESLEILDDVLIALMPRLRADNPNFDGVKFRAAAFGGVK